MKLCAQVAIINYLSEIWKNSYPVPSRASGVIWPFESTTSNFDMICPMFRVNKYFVRFIRNLLSPCLMIYYLSLPALSSLAYYWIPSETLGISLQLTLGLKKLSYFRFLRVKFSPLVKHFLMRNLASSSIVSSTETFSISWVKLASSFLVIFTFLFVIIPIKIKPKFKTSSNSSLHTTYFSTSKSGVMRTFIVLIRKFPVS